MIYRVTSSARATLGAWQLRLVWVFYMRRVSAVCLLCVCVCCVSAVCVCLLCVSAVCLLCVSAVCLLCVCLLWVCCGAAMWSFWYNYCISLNKSRHLYSAKCCLYRMKPCIFRSCKHFTIKTFFLNKWMDSVNRIAGVLLLWKTFCCVLHTEKISKT